MRHTIAICTLPLMMATTTLHAVSPMPGSTASAAGTHLRLSCLRVCSLHEPLGIDIATPTFSWQMDCDERDCRLTRFTITVTDSYGRTLWHSTQQADGSRTATTYAGAPLQSCTDYTWTLTATDSHRHTATASAHFGTAMLSPTDWQAQWIAAPDTIGHMHTVPALERTFTLQEGKTVSRARLYASALGVAAISLSGQPVTDAVLEPGESEYEHTVLYSTYDVTALMHPNTGDTASAGKAVNTITARLAGGIYDIDLLPGRFSKGEVTNNGQTALMAELHVAYTDGTTDTLRTDTTWTARPTATTGSNWWGGEDYDATLLTATGMDRQPCPQAQATVVTPHFTSPHAQVSGHGTLRSRMHEHLRVVEQWPAVKVSTTRSGGHDLVMVDFGRNYAGQYRFRLHGRRGQQISLRAGESLNTDGSVLMEEFYTGTADTYDCYTFGTTGQDEVWGPEFMYHGLRYLQIVGLDYVPDASAFTAMRIRADVEQAGHFATSNQLVNDIHTICRDAIASQLYNCITDCPHREKLGWLDVPNEMFVSLIANYDMQAYWHKVVTDCFDAQQADGMVPSVAPFYMRVYVDDPNWGGAAILVPYRCWRYYGDTTLMRRYYKDMCRLMEHYARHTSGHLIDNSLSVLSDWGQETAGVEPPVTTEFTETTTYYHLLCAMSEMAAELSHEADAQAFATQAAATRQAFNTKFYRGQGIYALGRQSELAMPLYYGLVPDGEEERVGQALAARVVADGYKVRTGEIALKPVLMSLARYGHNDIVWQMANQTDCPSYGYWVRQGYTTTPEYWDVGRFSQNHCMMDHIEEWFYTALAGITWGASIPTTHTAATAQPHHSDRALAINISPYFPPDLDSLDVATRCPRGRIRIAWKRQQQAAGKAATRHIEIEIPAGEPAVICLPVAAGRQLFEQGRVVTARTKGIHAISYANGYVSLLCGSGHYRLELKDGR